MAITITAAKKSTTHSGYSLDSSATLIQCDRCGESFANTGAAFAHRAPVRGGCTQPLKAGLSPRVRQGQRYWATFQI